jgi:hypothetical protein
MAKKRRAKRRPQSRRPPTQPPPQYPIATIAYYGPDDHTPTKIAVGIVNEDEEILALERWAGPDVTVNPEVISQIQQFVGQHGAKSVVITDGVIGCPHEEGIDYPLGEDCPFCPFWQGKQ